MKILFSLLVFVAISISSFSQSNEELLIEHFGKEKYDFYSENHPHKISFGTFYLYNSFELISSDRIKSKDINIEKVAEITCKSFNGLIVTIPSKDVEKKISQKGFNILTSDLIRDKNVDKYYFLEGTNKVICLYSEERANKLYNAKK